MKKQDEGLADVLRLHNQDTTQLKQQLEDARAMYLTEIENVLNFLHFVLHIFILYIFFVLVIIFSVNNNYVTNYVADNGKGYGDSRNTASYS